jgi:hypothetical protein
MALNFLLAGCDDTERQARLREVRAKLRRVERVER